MDISSVISFLILWSSLFISDSESAIAIDGATDKVKVTPLGDKTRYLAQMDENNHSFNTTTPMLKIEGSDDCPDIKVSFIAVSTFTNHITDCILYSDQSFDYENSDQRQYSMQLDFKTGERIIVQIQIFNIDDEKPTLTSPQCSFDEMTLYTKDDTPCSCTLEDPDGFLDYMTFVVQSGGANEDKIFEASLPKSYDNITTHTDVKLYNLEKLDYKQIRFYSFKITVTDSGDNSATQSAIVNVNDVRNTKPTWTKIFSFAEFPEKSHQDFSVSALDGDTGLNFSICYKKIHEDDEKANYINIDKNTGHIDVNYIDRDKDDITLYNFTMEACVCNLSDYCTDQTVNLYVQDIDDNPPLIMYNEYSNGTQTDFPTTDEKVVNLSFLENYAGAFNFTSYINDRDTAENAQFNVELEKFSDDTLDQSVAFIVVPSTGYRNGNFRINVKTASYLDFEDPNWKFIKFYLKSTGNLNHTMTDRMLVNIALEDYNDEFPTFLKKEYTASIKETAKTGDFVLQAQATDRDAEDQVLSMEILGGYAETRLSIDSDGNIVVNLSQSDGPSPSFDYDILKSVDFQVKATDHASHSTTVPVTLTIEDVNNKAPTIDPAEPVSVEENQKDGIPLNITLIANDPDTTANLTADIDWDKSYVTKNSIKLVDVSDKMKFLKVNTKSSNGGKKIEISLVVDDSKEEKPDFETFDTLYLALTVCDLNTEPDFIKNKCSSATILINIININDNPPNFPEDTQRENRTVQEQVANGTSVGFIKAVDPDNDPVTITCEADNKDFDWIELNSTNWGFTVKGEGLVNADYPVWKINYTCTASDGEFKTLLKVTFYVIDTNNKFPQITLPDIVKVKEKSKKDTKLEPALKTSDDDRDIPFHTVSCTLDKEELDCSNEFYVNAVGDDKVLTVTRGERNLDRDTNKANYSCLLQCTDNVLNERQQGMKTTSKNFIIYLIDINDNTPSLVEQTISCNESEKQGADVAMIIGSDIDEGPNAEITFSIINITNPAGDDIQSLFNITRLDDYERSLTTKQVHLFAVDDLRGHYGEYTFNIKLNDNPTDPEEEQNTNDTSIKFTIEKFNFAPPNIIFPVKDASPISLWTSQDLDKPLVLYKGKTLSNFKATDGETTDCSKWDVTFTYKRMDIYSEKIFAIKKIKSCEAQLQINNNFFNTKDVTAKVYTLEVTAWIKSPTDSPKENEEPYSSSVNISLVFFNNSIPPLFPQNTWEFSFLEADKTQTELLAYNASYNVPNVDDFSIYYSLITAGDDDAAGYFFSVDNVTGTVSVQEEFYYDNYTQFKFRILATSDGITDRDNKPDQYLNVTLNVICTNRRPPAFSTDNYFGAIMPNFLPGSAVTSIDATDPDSCDQGRLQFTISGDVQRFGNGLDNIPVNPFIISTANDEGNINLNFAVESSMNGHFEFPVNVTDQPDGHGNGPNNDTATVTIFIITSENTVDFRFYNNITDVQVAKNEMLKIVGDIVGYEAYSQSIDIQADSGQNFTRARLYFLKREEDDGNISLLSSSSILKIVSNIDTYSKLSSRLKTELSLYLYSFPSSNSDNSEEKLRKWLIGVSTVLGLLCLLLLGALVWKTWRLNQTISKLTTKKFGSQDSGLNRLGVSAPTTNKHAIEGSNPVYKNEEIKKPKEMADFDTHSIRSGDSDLIGIENNPEFDYNFNSPEAKTTYL